MHPHMDMHICTTAKMQVKVYTVCKMTRKKKVCEPNSKNLNQSPIFIFLKNMMDEKKKKSLE